MFSYYITTHFITNNKYYNSCRNPHSVYQMYPQSTWSNLISNCPLVHFGPIQSYSIHFILIGPKIYSFCRLHFQFWAEKNFWAKLFSFGLKITTTTKKKKKGIRNQKINHKNAIKIINIPKMTLKLKFQCYRHYTYTWK